MSDHQRVVGEAWVDGGILHLENVIGQDGVVKYSEQTPTPKDLPNFQKVKETLAKLQ